jgi:hypothetical protein
MTLEKLKYILRESISYGPCQDVHLFCKDKTLGGVDSMIQNASELLVAFMDRWESKQFLLLYVCVVTYARQAAGSSSTGNGKSGTLWKKQLWLVATLASPVILLLHLGSLIRRDKAEERRRIEIERHIRRSFEDYDYFISTKDKFF